MIHCGRAMMVEAILRSDYVGTSDEVIALTQQSHGITDPIYYGPRKFASFDGGVCEAISPVPFERRCCFSDLL